jgi:hypothetical protein
MKATRLFLDTAFVQALLNRKITLLEGSVEHSDNRRSGLYRLAYRS